MENYTIVLAHPDKQHSYYTAKALDNAGWLMMYVTIIYDKPHSITRVLKSIIPNRYKNQISRFRCDDLKDNQIKTICVVQKIIQKILCMIIPSKAEQLRVKLLRRFNRIVAKTIIKKSPDVFIGYDTLCGDVFDYLNKHNSNTIRIVDMSAPCYLSMIEMMDEYSNADCLTSEVKKRFLARKRMDRARQARLELVYADAFLVASDFTANTLVKCGISKQKIFKCSYGLNPCKTFKNEVKKKEPGSRLTGIYIGNINVMKGVHTLMKALNTVDECINCFYFVGEVQDEELTSRENSKYFYKGFIPHDDVLRLCCDADFAVFPSLADGFGFAVSECMNLGIPVICSKNAGASDLIEDGVNGFLFDAGESNQISEAIRKMYDNPELLTNMKKNASTSLQGKDWEKYYSQVIEAITSIVRAKRNCTND